MKGKIKKLKLVIAILIAVSMVIPGKVAYASLPSTYQLGLSKAKVYELIGQPLNYDETGTKSTVDYRKIQGEGREKAEYKPAAQFEILSNGKVVATSDAGRNLDAPTVVAELNINDDITIRDKSKAYKGSLYLWDLQYRSGLQRGQGVLATK